LDVRPRIVIFCEGKVTEREYIEGLKKREQINLAQIIVAKETGTPKTLVEQAKKYKKSIEQDEYGKNDEIWCVFDRDEHPFISETKQQARDNGLKTAMSNPCFELWLLLHFKYHSSHISREVAVRQCKKHMPDYEKHISPAIFAHVNTAIQHAQRLSKWQQSRNNSGENPSTDVHVLVERLRNSSKAALLKQIRTK
jgi:hypothetical protein